MLLKGSPEENELQFMQYCQSGSLRPTIDWWNCERFGLKPKYFMKTCARNLDKCYFCEDLTKILPVHMIRLVTLLISIALQLIASIFALRLMRVTKYRASWVLISLGFLLMAIVRTIKLIQFVGDDFSFYLTMADDWLGVVISFLFTAGVFLIGEIFYSDEIGKVDSKSISFNPND